MKRYSWYPLRPQRKLQLMSMLPKLSNMGVAYLIVHAFCRSEPRGALDRQTLAS